MTRPGNFYLQRDDEYLGIEAEDLDSLKFAVRFLATEEDLELPVDLHNPEGRFLAKALNGPSGVEFQVFSARI